MVDITNCLLSENCGLRIHEDIEDFYYINENHYDGNFKDYLEEYRLFAKQYGYDFDLMKDIDDYEKIKKDVEEFHQDIPEFLENTDENTIVLNSDKKQ